MPLFLPPEYGCAVVIPSSIGECVVLLASKKSRIAQLALGYAGTFDRPRLSTIISKSPPYGAPAGHGTRAELVPAIISSLYSLLILPADRRAIP